MTMTFDEALASADGRDTEQRQTRLSTTMYGSADVNPEREASLRILAKQANVPVEAVYGDDGAEAKRIAASNRAELIDQDNPALGKFLMDQDNARVSMDDIETLSAIDRVSRHGFGPQGGSTLGVGNPYKTERMKTVGRSVLQGLSVAPERINEVLAGKGQQVAEFVDWSLQGFADPLGVRKRAADVANESREYWKRQAEAKLSKTEAGTAENYAQQIGQSVGTSMLLAPFGLGGQEAALSLFSLAADGGYQEMKTAGVHGGLAGPLSLSNSAMEGLTELIGVKSLYKTGSTFGKKIAEFTFKDLLGEEINTVYNAVVDKVTTRADMGMGDLGRQLLDTAIVTAFGGPVQGAATYPAAKGFEKLFETQQKAAQATRNKEAILALGDSVKGSKLRARMPEKLQELIRMQREEYGTPEHAYVDAETLTTLWQSAGLDPSKAAEDMLADPQSYYEAVATGGEVAIPLEEFAVKFSGEEYFQSLIEDTRLGMGASTPKEAAAWQSEGMTGAIEQLLADAETQSSVPADNRVYDDVLGQLLPTGMERGTSERNALLMSSVFKSLAARTGSDAMELYQRFPLTIGRQLPDVLAKRVQVGSLDPLLDELRAGNQVNPEELQGQSLLDFARELGVSDDRGDLKSMDVDKKGTRKPFQKKLLRADGLALDKLREAAVEAGYLDEGATTTDLLDALGSSLKGSHVYSKQKSMGPEFDRAVTLQQLGEYLGQVGIELAQQDNESVRRVLNQSVKGGELWPVGGDVLFQGKDNIKRGFFRFGDGSFNIGLLEKADLSTFLHESAHFYLEVLNTLASDETASPQIKEDYATILSWLGAESREAMTVEHLEKFARGFESYMMEGKAPSIELQSAFSRFRAWLVNIYQEIRNLGVKLNEDVRGVFDRLVATDEEITAARERQNLQEIFATAEDMGVSESEFAIYRAAGERASRQETDKLTREYMAELTRQQNKWWKEWIAKLSEEIDEETKSEPVYVAIQVLTKGVTFDGMQLDLKLDRKALEKAYGKEFVKRLPKGIYAKENGLTADQVGELAGFDSGDAMIKDMVAAPKRKDFIAAEADRRMREIHGDKLTDGTAADDATAIVLGDERAKVLTAEHRAMRKLQRLADKVGRVKEGEERQQREEARQSIPPLEYFKKLAQRTMAGKQVGKLNPYQYAQASAKAAREAYQLAGKKDYLGAAEAKQRQILNHYLHKEAAYIQRATQKQVERWNKITRKSDERLAKGRDMGLVDAVRAVLARHGIGRSEEEAFAALDQIRKYNPALYEDVQMAVDAATQRPKPWVEMTVEEFNGLADAVNNLWHLSARSKEIDIDGRMMAIEDIGDELGARISDLGGAKKQAGLDRAVTRWQKAKQSLHGIVASLARVEHWVEYMDGGPNGPFRKYIFQPVIDGVNKYRQSKNDVLKRYESLLNVHMENITFDKIDAQNIGYTFSDKGELLHALLHTGNESNLRKLLLGRGWGYIAEDGGLNTEAWDAFISKMIRDQVITKADYDFIQGVWDLLEDTKVGAQQAHHDMYGYYFSEVSANELNTPFGTYRGGYMPAITDSAIVRDQAIRDERDSMEGFNNAYMFPTTGKGFTKSRVEYNRPLLLDLGYIPAHIDKVLRFTHIEPRVKDVARLTMNKPFRELLDNFSPQMAEEMITPWLQRTAKQAVETQVSGEGYRGFMTVCRTLRKRSGLAAMALNVANTMQQLTGFSLSAVQVKTKYLRNAFVAYVQHPMQMSSDVAEVSTFMRHRTTTQIFEVQKHIDNITLNKTTLDKIEDFTQEHGYVLQAGFQNFVDVITWRGAYDQALTEGVDDKEAIERADSAVRMTQGSFNPEDISRVETGNAFTRMFTMFYSYFNMNANLVTAKMSATMRDLGMAEGKGKMVYLAMAGFYIPAMFSELMMQSMTGRLWDDDDDDGYLDNILAVILGGPARTAAAMVPAIGMLANYTVNMLDKNRSNDRISASPIVTFLESSFRAPISVYNTVVADKPAKAAIKDTLSAIAIATGIPVTAAGKPAGYLADVAEDRVDPANPADFVRGMLSGTGPRNK